ncbi:MAG: TonB-dependent receptor [Ignavibacteria bacterium]|nr:TonB-dependent receptor [Ignavibacteria bacterium]MBP7092799.1 TonB-dependent receptor [Candidatus Kapabacteria bacterium]MBK6419821.1 TonB-dependent receptor [Ignavibacteria bacterium]MBK6759548.1 TonB-dependent receptor [Ignavibacteria bacterium]MBK7184438.1 TonB-dependent receptor [Ignavibacteria bacterium]
MWYRTTISALFILSSATAYAQDSVRTVIVREVVVEADPLLRTWRLDRPISTSSSVDDLMRLGGLTLIQRANGFAGEASMLGLRGGQMNTSIDGMKIHAACVDKMDPSTAYVEIDNLSTLDVSSDATDLRYGQNLGGSVNFTLKQPTLNSPVRSVIDLSGESNASMRRLRADLSGGTPDLALRAGYTLRSADDLRSGDGSTISLSGFTKHNIQVGGLWQAAKHDAITATFIADLATDVGYPSLIMDTRRAQALIGAVAWRSTWSPSVTTSAKLYANAVDHTMDDYDRPLSEIENRDFMPNMYMPMAGTTNVYGLLAEGAYTEMSNVVKVVLDATYLAATATMQMIPLDTSVSTMNMTNIGDARIGTIGTSASWEHLVSEDLTIRTGVRVDVSTRTLQDQSFRSVLGGYYPGVDLDQIAGAISVNAAVYYTLAEDVQVWSVLARSERMPTHLEMYGFWLYDPQANIVTIGRPDLANERAWSIDVGTSYRTEDLRASVSAWVRRIDNYIAPVPTQDTAASGQPPTRYMGSIGTADLTGFDASATIRVLPWWSMQASVRGIWGVGVTIDDPLPLIAPIQASIRAVVGERVLQGEVAVYASAAQKRISRSILPEDATASWARADVLIAWRPITELRIQASCTNVLDTFYHEHTSINNMPSRGRSFNLGVRAEL